MSRRALSTCSKRCRGWLKRTRPYNFLSLVLAMQNVVARRDLGVATSFGQFTRSIGGAAGVALLGAVIAAALQDPAAPVAADMVRGIHRAFWLAALVAGVAVVPALWIPGGLPADLVHPDQMMVPATGREAIDEA